MKSGERDGIGRSVVITISWELSICFGACKERKSEHTPQGEGITANCDNKSSKTGAQRNFIFVPLTKLLFFSKINYSLVQPFISDMHPTPVFIYVE